MKSLEAVHNCRATGFDARSHLSLFILNARPLRSQCSIGTAQLFMLTPGHLGHGVFGEFDDVVIRQRLRPGREDQQGKKQQSLHSG